MGFINMQTNYQSGDTPPKDYPPTKVRNISFISNRALGGGIGAGWICSVNDVCEDITVVNNIIETKHNPWGCHYIHTYNASKNSPPGLPECMKNSMNRTFTKFDDLYEQKQAAIRLWKKSHTPQSLRGMF